MLKILKSAIALTNNNLMLVCFLYLFSVASTVFLAISQVATNVAGHTMLLYCLTMVAFFAGYFNQIKTAIKPEEGKLKFLEGIGDYFLPMLGIALLSLLLYVLLAEVGTFVVAKIVGGVPVLTAAVNKVMEVLQASQGEVSALDMQAIQIVSVLMFVLWLLWCAVSFLILYWVPVLYFDDKRNIFISLVIAIKFLLKQFWKSLFMYIMLLFPVVFFSILSVALSSFKPVAVLCNILIYYVSVVFLFSVFLLYVEKVEEDKEKVQ